MPKSLPVPFLEVTSKAQTQEDDDDDVVYICDSAERSVYDTLTTLLEHYWHGDAITLSWLAVRRDDCEVVIMINSSDDMCYVLHPWAEAGGTVWEFADVQDGEHHVLWAETRLAAASAAVAHVSCRDGAAPQRRWSDRLASPTRH